MKAKLQKYRLLIIGIIVGVVYGIIARLTFGAAATMASVTYMFLIPAVLGVIPLFFANEEQLKSYRNIIFIPWISLATFSLFMYAVGLEGFLCLLILAGPFFIFGTIGAFLFRLLQIHRRNKRNTMMVLAVLPFLISPLEEAIKSPSEVNNVSSEVVIDASPEYIWQHIIRVDEIKTTEYTPGYFNYLGIPRPVKAELEKDAVGAKRVGHFEGGLVFVEHVTEREENKKITFDIVVDPNTVRPVVFDQHVLNGNYFSFVNASYELHQINAKQVKLKLISGYRLTSKINYYSKFWGDIILKDFQDRLLQVIKKRCDGNH